MDLITIIVPVYRVETYLTACLSSIVEQTYRELQIILVDDGSPDSCPAICDQWADKDGRITVIHKSNGGLSDARNVGLDHVKGKYVCFVDSDDILDPHYVEWMYNAVSAGCVKLAACDIHCFYDEEAFEDFEGRMDFNIYSAEEALNDILHGRGVRAVVWNKIYDAELLQHEKFVTGRYHEDEFFSYRIIDKAGKMAFVDAPLYHYRQRPGSIMSTFSSKHIDVLEAYLERLELLKKKYPELYKKDKMIFCVSCVSYYRMSLKYGADEIKEIEHRIIYYRKKVRFSIIELTTYSSKEVMYILGSRYALKYFTRLLCMLRGGCG